MTLTRIHVVGCAGTGKTLIKELLLSCFDATGHSEHEVPILVEPDIGDGVYVSEMPHDENRIGPYLKHDPGLHVIYMLRDPRSVISNRPVWGRGKYIVPLWSWRESVRLAARLRDQERFLIIRYEDLVSSPDEMQDTVMLHMPLLRKRHNFSDFHLVANPSELSLRILRGLRPIAPQSGDGWQRHLPRIKAQIERDGPISDDLIRLGYERDRRWEKLLDGVVPDHGASVRWDRPDTGPWAAWRRLRLLRSRVKAAVIARRRRHNRGPSGS
jgi:hypothetical protein